MIWSILSDYLLDTPKIRNIINTDNTFLINVGTKFIKSREIKQINIIEIF